MILKGNGFTSTEGRKKAKRIVKRHSKGFLLLESTLHDCRSFAKSISIRKQKTDEEKQKIIALVVFIRLLEITETALLVMKNGMSNEANTLFRVFLDAYFVFANICSDASFVASYITSDETMRLKLMNSVKKHDSDLFKKINEYATEEIKAELKQKIREENIQAFNSYAYAHNVDCSEIYDSMYRLMSAAIHTTPRSLEKYIEEDENGNIVDIKYYPVEEDIPDRVFDFTAFLINVLSGLQEVFGSLDVKEIEAKKTELNETKEEK